MKAQGLNFIPLAIRGSINFSQMQPYEVEQLSDQVVPEEEKFDQELKLLNLIYEAKSDKQRCVLMLELMRELGFNFDYSSCARSLHINLRWYMRVKKSLKDLLKSQSDSHI